MKSKKIVTKKGTEIWKLPDGRFHRTDGPAVRYVNGGQEWWFNGLLHREDGPAFTRSDGTQAWRLNGILHREDGPALTWSDGSQFWYLNGKEYAEQQFNVKTKRIKELEEMLKGITA